MLSEFPISDLGNVTATAVLGWYAWHTASKTIPNTLRAFREEAALTRADCRKERETLYQELSAERLQRHSDHMAIVEALNELSLHMRKPERT